MLREFRDFAVKGNMVDMAVGIVIGGAFGAIVKSLVDDVSGSTSATSTSCSATQSRAARTPRSKPPARPARR